MSAIQQTAAIDSKTEIGVNDTLDAEVATTIDKATEAISKKEFATALSLLLPLLSEHSQNEGILYLIAVAQRYLGDTSSALATLTLLVACAPTHGRAYQEEGHNYRVLGDAEAALRAYS
ncbi:MAG: hypothetical protein MUR45_02165, partial [OM182 bacterium]|nr:hypothetical protein [OM182 bacterium]